MEKLDIVYILGTGSRWRNNEIRYSLRSVQKFMEFGRVFIIGECPEWLTGVIHIPIKDESNNKLMNARKKFLVAAKDGRISKDFILMNDDFFAMRPIKEIKNYSRGTLSEMINRHPTGGGYYYKALVDTKNMIECCGVEYPVDFEVHAPIILNKNKLRTVIEMTRGEKPYNFRSVYGNIYQLEPEYVMDFKISNLAEFAHQRKRDPEFLSINDFMVAQKEFRDWLRLKFRHPSRFELDRGEGPDILPGAPLGSMKYYAKKSFTYYSKPYSVGEIIEDEIMDEIRNIPKMKECWELK